MIEILLVAERYQVQTFSSGDEVVAHLLLHTSALNPLAVLTDLHMPGLSGNALARKLRMVCGPSVKLLVMSGSHPTSRTVEQYDGLLSKPFSVKSFAKALRGTAAGIQMPEPVSKRSATEALDLSTYQSLQATMPLDRVRAMYDLCIADARIRIDRLRQHADNRDDQAYRNEAHTIKGGCGMLGAIEMRNLADKMEILGCIRCNSVDSNDLAQELLAASERLERMLSAPEGRAGESANK